MTSRQIALVRSSWQLVLPIERQAAALFYQRLFDLDPDLAPLFRGNITEQGDKLMAMLGMVVSRLDRLAELRPAVEQLGRQHAEYGVEASTTTPSAPPYSVRCGPGSATSLSRRRRGLGGRLHGPGRRDEAGRHHDGRGQLIHGRRAGSPPGPPPTPHPSSVAGKLRFGVTGA